MLQLSLNDMRSSGYKQHFPVNQVSLNIVKTCTFIYNNNNFLSKSIENYYSKLVYFDFLKLLNNSRFQASNSN